MKVYVYENFDEMYIDSYRNIEINEVNDIQSSTTGGWLIVTDNTNYCFPVTVFIRVDKDIT